MNLLEKLKGFESMEPEPTPKILLDFLNCWKEIISKIENTPMSESELNPIIEEFNKGVKTLLFTQTLLKHEFKGNSEDWIERFESNNSTLEGIRMRLVTARSISHSKWKETHPGLLDRVKIKIEQISFSIFGKP